MGEKEGGGDGVFHVCMYMINKRQEEEAKGRGAEPMIPTDSIYPRVLLTRHFLFFSFAFMGKSLICSQMKSITKCRSLSVNLNCEVLRTILSELSN